MKVFSKILFVLLSILYPILVFSCLVIFKVPAKIFSLFIVFIALIYLLMATGGKENFSEKIKKNLRLLVSAGLLLLAGIICLATGQTLFIKLYPVLMNLIFLFTFGSTLFISPNICFRFACLADKKLASSMIARRVESYCFKVTLVWCIFFILNGSAALYTVFSKNDRIWSIYNGGIAYLIMGLLFAVEFIVRKVVNSKMPKSIPLSKFTAASHDDSMIMCYEGKWSDKKYLTWGDFLRVSGKIRSFIKQHSDCEKWILHCEDYWYFICSFAALLQCKKEILLTANISPNFIAEIRSDKAIRFLTDQTEVEGKKIENADFIPSIADSEISLSDSEIRDIPAIDADSSRIMMYTSGTTGHPKTVPQRLTEFEADNAFVLSQWGDEFLRRKLVATVSQHHIYGLLFTMMLPFTIGEPFRRKRIEFPQEFEALDDEEYMIIAVPAFLKRTNAEMDGEKLNLKNPWIFTSGGVLLPEVAKETNEIFGFCPMEVYGSTETSGIAYRQQTKDGNIWTPFANAKIWKNDAGCLTIISPYIKDPAGFATGDLVDIQEDGRFILKGRADSIVKIEEKRISVTEVESRLLQSGLVLDCCVVPMSDRRQYLAAALVLNEEGKAKFASTEKYLINRYFHDYLLQFFENVVLPKKWRYLDALPMDVQGKKKKPVIQKLFAPENIHGIPAETLMLRRENDKNLEVELEVLIPATSDYFDGHFPDFKLLPAVAQVDLVAHFAQRYFGTELSTPDIKRFKFTDKLLPDSTVVFKLKFDGEKNKVSFEISDFTGSKVYSTGTYIAKK
ncbi:MAG: AMP-binding protein [Treponema sp.]|nr:AMP-binding protein [Treponema sp.]